MSADSPTLLPQSEAIGLTKPTIFSIPAKASVDELRSFVERQRVRCQFGDSWTAKSALQLHSLQGEITFPNEEEPYKDPVVGVLQPCLCVHPELVPLLPRLEFTFQPGDPPYQRKRLLFKKFRRSDIVGVIRSDDPFVQPNDTQSQAGTGNAGKVGDDDQDELLTFILVLSHNAAALALYRDLIVQNYQLPQLRYRSGTRNCFKVQDTRNASSASTSARGTTMFASAPAPAAMMRVTSGRIAMKETSEDDSDSVDIVTVNEDPIVVGSSEFETSVSPNPSPIKVVSNSVPDLSRLSRPSPIALERRAKSPVPARSPGLSPARARSPAAMAMAPSSPPRPRSSPGVVRSARSQHRLPPRPPAAPGSAESPPRDARAKKRAGPLPKIVVAKKQRRIAPTLVSTRVSSPPRSAAAPSATVMASGATQKDPGAVQQQDMEAFLPKSMQSMRFMLNIPNPFPRDVFSDMRDAGLLGAVLDFDAHAQRTAANWLETAHIVYDSLVRQVLTLEPRAVAFGAVDESWRDDQGSEFDHYFADVHVAAASSILTYRLKVYPPAHPQNTAALEVISLTNTVRDAQRFEYVGSTRLPHGRQCHRLIFTPLDEGCYLAWCRPTEPNEQDALYVLSNRLVVMAELQVPLQGHRVTAVEMDAGHVMVGTDDGSICIWELAEMDLCELGASEIPEKQPTKHISAMPKEQIIFVASRMKEGEMLYFFATPRTLHLWKGECVPETLFTDPEGSMQAVAINYGATRAVIMLPKNVLCIPVRGTAGERVRNKLHWPIPSSADSGSKTPIDPTGPPMSIATLPSAAQAPQVHFDPSRDTTFMTLINGALHVWDVQDTDGIILRHAESGVRSFDIMRDPRIASHVITAAARENPERKELELVAFRPSTWVYAAVDQP